MYQDTEERENKKKQKAASLVRTRMIYSRKSERGVLMKF